MIEISEAEKILDENCLILGTEPVDLGYALGRVSAEDIFTETDLPSFSSSGMDGFAVLWDDVQKLSAGIPVGLNIIGESSAGIPFNGIIERGRAVRISTGAAIPENCDCIIPVEDTIPNGVSVKILRARSKFQHIRFKGEEFKVKDKIISADTEITPPVIGLLVSAGITEVRVYKKPSMAIITTGNELIKPGEKKNDHQVFDSNSYVLKALLNLTGYKINESSHIEDDPEKMTARIKQIRSDNDVIIVSGGVSAGNHDHVKESADEAGFPEIFRKVNQRPGKPFFFAKSGEKYFFGLPGNPVSTLICFIHYVLPFLKKLENKKSRRIADQVFSDGEIVNNSERADFVFVKKHARNSKIYFKKIDGLKSHLISKASNADGYVIVPPDSKISNDQVCGVFRLPW